MLEPRAERPGENAFAALWLLPYDGLPQAQYAHVLTEDEVLQRQAYQQRLAAFREGRNGNIPSMPVSSADGSWPKVPAMELSCSLRDADCLSKVRANPAAYAAALAQQQALLARLDDLPRYGHVQSPFPADVAMPLPAYSLLTRSLTARALAHVQGRSDEALAGICHDVRTGRMLMSQSDSLIGAMVGGAMVQGGSGLFAQILAELPLSHPLPVACEVAFALPAADELSLCEPMRGEFALVGSVYPALLPSTASRLLLDEEKTLARSALTLGHACSEPVRQALLEDRPIPPAPGLGSLWSLQCAANATGCILSDIAAPAYAKYHARLQDAGAQLRLVAVLLWMREQGAAEGPAILLERVPSSLRSPGRGITLATDGRALVMPRYSDESESRPAPGVALPLAWKPATP